MADDSGQERSQEPTGRRIEQFLEEGKIPRSKEITAGLGLALASLVFINGAPFIFQDVASVYFIAVSMIPVGDMSATDAINIGGRVMYFLAMALFPTLGLIWLGTVAIGLVHGRANIPKDPIKIDFQRIDPMGFIKEQYFSSTPLVELAKGLAKLGLIGWMLWTAVTADTGYFPAFMYREPSGLLAAYLEMVLLVLYRALPVMLVLSVLDYAYQWYRLQEQMMMTKEEVKEEGKQTEGDPHIKAARKKRAFQLAMGQALANVKKADLVITNPTHYAVAIRYRKEEASAPVVLARGVDHFAMKIRAEARRHDIPQVENRELARALYKEGRENKMIPEALFSAVAKVMAVIIRRRMIRNTPSLRQR
jgi:flagellar biosynthesis protein FlhB